MVRRKSKWMEKWLDWDAATDQTVYERDVSCLPCYAEGRMTAAAIHHILGRGQSKEQTAAKYKVMVCNSHHPPKHEMPGAAWPYVHQGNRLLLALLRRHHGYDYGSAWNEPIDENWGIPMPDQPIPPEPPEPEEDDEPPWPSE